MYHALYRKYRPQTFADVVGQDAITAALKNQIAGGKIGHAYIFTGTRGTGKTTCAKIFARAVNCLTPKEGEPCGQCEICRGFAENRIFDVVEIDAATYTGVDDIRELRDDAAYTPANCTYKVYIIDEVHMLTANAFNALLKIMEEPPAHVIFILATTEIQKVPATILSRCQRYDFGRIPPEIIEKRLLAVAAAEKIELSEPAAALIARLADGAMRDGLSILDTCVSAAPGAVDEELVRRMAGVTDKSYLFSLSGAIAGGDAVQATSLVAALREKSIDMKRLCSELIAHYRTIMLIGAGAGELAVSLSDAERGRYREEAARVPLAAAVAAMRALGDCLDRMGRSTDPRIELELTLFALCGYTAPAAMPAPQPAPQPAAAPAAPAQAAAPSPATPAPAAATPPASAPEAAAETAETAAPAAFWPQVIALSEKSDPLVHGFLAGSKAYLQGRRVLIDGSKLFFNFMKTNADSNERLKDLITQVTGEHYSIGPYQKPETPGSAPAGNAQKMLQQIADNGVPVEYR